MKIRGANLFVIVPMYKIKFKHILSLYFFQSSNFAFLLYMCHLPDSDQKLVVFCWQIFERVLRGLLHEGYFLVLLQVF